MSHKVGVIGAGAWGTAVAKVIAENGHDVTLWSYETEVADSINKDHENQRYLPEIILPGNLDATTNLAESAAGKDFLILALPSLFIINAVRSLVTIPDIQEGKAVIGVLTKGFIQGQDVPKLIVESIENFLPGFYKNSVVYISGPSHAEEVGKGKITGLISASPNPKNSIKIRELLAGKTFRVFASLDVVGVQVAAALKNVIAIAFGIMDALKETQKNDIFGDNTESLLLAAGLNEIQILGQALGATHPETFTSIAGVGDLDVTCRSQYGRNRRFGREIILKNILDGYSDIENLISNITNLPYLPEGVVASKFAYQVKEKFKLKVNIIDIVYKILNKELNPNEALRTLI
jgi:glycerol-3-phosphate dehydrogenase (NAD(P)+)